MAPIQICGISFENLQTKRNEAKAIGMNLRESLEKDDEITKVATFYELLLSSDQLKSLILKKSGAQSFIDLKFCDAITHTNMVVQKLLELHKRPRFELSIPFIVSKIDAIRQECNSERELTRACHQIIGTIEEYSALYKQFVEASIVTPSEQPTLKGAEHEAWDAHITLTSANEQERVMLDSKKETLEKVKNKVLDLYSGSLTSEKPNVYQLDICRLVLENRFKFSHFTELSNGIPLFYFIGPDVTGLLTTINSSFADEEDFKILKEINFPKSRIADQFMALTFATSTPPTPITPREEKFKKLERRSQAESESEEFYTPITGLERERTPNFEAFMPETPLLQDPSPHSQEEVSDSNSDAPRGTGRYARRKKEKYAIKAEPPSPSIVMIEPSPYQQEGTRSESPLSDQDDIDEHFLDDLHAQSEFSIRRIYNLAELPKMQSHQIRFWTITDEPQEVHETEVLEQDIVVPLNDSSRATCFVLTFDRNTRKPIFNRVISHRRNRYS